MKANILILFILFLSFKNSSSQTTFVKKYTTLEPLSDATSMVEDVSGGYLFNGWSIDKATDSIYSFLTKCDTLGNVMWVKYYDASLFYNVSMKRFVNGDLLMIGSDIIIRSDNMGNIIWAKQFSGITGVPMNSYVITSDGGVAMAAYTQIIGDLTLDIVKLDSIGNVSWSMKTPVIQYRPSSNRIIECSDGGFLISCNVYDSIGYIRAVIIKTDLSGNIVWTKSIDGSGYTEVLEIFETSDGNYLFSGFNSGGTSIFKLDTFGTLMWSKLYGQNYELDFNKMYEKQNGNLILAGSCKDSLSRDILFMTTDSVGDIVNAIAYSADLYGYVHNIMKTADNGYIALCRDGYWDGIGPFESNFIEIIKMDSALESACNSRIVNYTIVNQTLSSGLGINLTPSAVTLNPVSINSFPNQMTTIYVCKSIYVEDLLIDDLVDLYPNPSINKVNLEISSGRIQNVSIYDLSGKQLNSISIKSSTLEIDVSTLAHGLYFLNGFSDQGIFRKRFVKN